MLIRVLNNDKSPFKVHFEQIKNVRLITIYYFNLLTALVPIDSLFPVSFDISTFNSSSKT